MASYFAFDSENYFGIALKFTLLLGGWSIHAAEFAERQVGIKELEISPKFLNQFLISSPLIL